jgi:hypothetical protein
MGAGGTAGAYRFDPDTGLSKDPRLAYYLQDLTPSQLQTALDGGSPNQDLLELLYQEQTGTGAGWLPCGTADNPTCGPPPDAAGKPGLTTMLMWGAFAFGVVFLGIEATKR